MKPLLSLIVGITIMMTSGAQAQASASTEQASRRFSPDLVRSVSPALEAHIEQRIHGDLWSRPGLAKRDRALATIAILIARNEPTTIGNYADRALQYGLKPKELSEAILHLAYYTGWGNAMAAVEPVSEIFKQRGIGIDQLPDVAPKLLVLDEAAEAQRAKRVGEQFGSISPGTVQYTTDYLFRDLWLRPDLSPRDRSMITVTALMTLGQVEQLPTHLNKAMDNGLTEPEVGELITQVAFYAGWPRAFSAMPVAKKVFAERAAK